jgi:hypothetical protein
MIAALAKGRMFAAMATIAMMAGHANMAVRAI